jgi:hypothetical protein
MRNQWYGDYRDIVKWGNAETALSEKSAMLVRSAATEIFKYGRQRPRLR